MARVRIGFGVGIVGSEWSKVSMGFFDRSWYAHVTQLGGNQILSALRCLPLGVALLCLCFLEGQGSPTNPRRPSPLLPWPSPAHLFLSPPHSNISSMHAVPPVLPFGRIKPPCMHMHSCSHNTHASTDRYIYTHLISYPVQYTIVISPQYVVTLH
jgi:hypothetical protein